MLVLLAGFAGLGALSWIDDRRALSPAVRLARRPWPSPLCLASLPPEARVLQVAAAR